MDTVSENLIQRKALEISNWIQDAVSDMSHEMHSEDIQADEMYNDKDILQDLCGDRICDAAVEICGTSRDPEFSLHFIAIAEAMKEQAHSALASALDILIKRRQP